MSQSDLNQVTIACCVGDIARALGLLQMWQASRRPLPDRFMIIRTEGLWRIQAKNGDKNFTADVPSSQLALSKNPNEIMYGVINDIAEKIGCKVPMIIINNDTRG